MISNPVICVIGLGYVGLPLAHAFGKSSFRTIGYDIDSKRIIELKQGIDRTGEMGMEDMKNSSIEFSNDPGVISEANVIILAIPTPVDKKNCPDLSLLESATETVGKHLQKGSVVVYESTVYPGVTEEICGPILEKHSGLVCGKDFHLGYSPERINPGDREHTVNKIVKVVAGQDEETTAFLTKLYGSIIEAGIHASSSIKVAEMAKAIENAQRDLNIAYINEIAILCNKIGISTKDVLDAASTKWNFLRFSPGLVGGHCIGVDPYYLLEKARSLEVSMPMITGARLINDGMSAYIATRIVTALRADGRDPRASTVLVLGLTFKENVPDTRNSKSKEVVTCLQNAGCTVLTHDPYVDNHKSIFEIGQVEAIALLVPHREYIALQVKDYAKLANETCIFFDLKSVFSVNDVEKAHMRYLSL